MINDIGSYRTREPRLVYADGSIRTAATSSTNSRSERIASSCVMSPKTVAVGGFEKTGTEHGKVVVGQGGGKEADVFGDAPNIASRV